MIGYNSQFRLASRPVGTPKRSDWSHDRLPLGELESGRVRVRVQYVSLDPAMRGWMNEGKSYMPSVKLGEVMRAFGAGCVIESKHPDFAVGEYVTGVLGVQKFASMPAAGLQKVDPTLAPLPRYLGALGVPGVTAYFGLLEAGRPVAGQTVLVSGAAGAVGSLVGQIAGIRGCRVVGIAGGQRKCRYLVEGLGFDAALDYKSDLFLATLDAALGDGVDIFFDNVGGKVLDAGLARLARGARVVICGAISQYNATGQPRGPSNYLSLLAQRATMSGIVVGDYALRWDEAVTTLAGWLSAGRIKAREEVVDGFENFPEALLGLFTGEHVGKLVLRVED
jgi:NADPH-dependent curcumin reductase CurA